MLFCVLIMICKECDGIAVTRNCLSHGRVIDYLLQGSGNASFN
jgi:hypothetical protein